MLYLPSCDPLVVLSTGGNNAITVYLKGDAPPTTPSPVESPAPTPAPMEDETPAPVPAGEYEELGCAVDNVPTGTRVRREKLNEGSV